MLELARPSDRDAVNILAKQIHSMHIAWRPDIYKMPEELFSEGRFSEEIHNRQLYVERLNDLVVGYVVLRIRECNAPSLISRKVMLVDEICVNENFRRQGIGSTIITEVRALARAFGCTNLQLGVYPQNDEAISFYQKCGFTIQSITMSTAL